MIFSANQVTTDHLRRAAYLYQVLDDVLLVAVDHPTRVTSSICKGEKSALIGRSYRDWGASKGSAKFSDTTGSASASGTPGAARPTRSGRP